MSDDFMTEQQIRDLTEMEDDQLSDIHPATVRHLAILALGFVQGPKAVRAEERWTARVWPSDKQITLLPPAEAHTPLLTIDCAKYQTEAAHYQVEILHLMYRLNS